MRKMHPPPPPKEVTPLFLSNPPQKLRSCQAPPFFKIWLELQAPPPQVEMGGHPMCPKWIFLKKITNKIFVYLLVAPFILQNF